MQSTFVGADFLLPRKNIDLNKWAVVACDQHTSDPAFWTELSDYVGGAPSALRLVLPECFLDTAAIERQAAAINAAADKYLADGVFASYSGMVFVERTLSGGGKRYGVVACVDLDAYGYTANAKTPVRASEGTVAERIPPRAEIRKNCLVEIPHIMLLIDDPDRTVIEPYVDKGPPLLYDFELSRGGGRIKGGLIADTSEIAAALGKLEAESVRRYGSPFLSAAGDGNHSLAAAKAHWERVKAAGDTSSPARYALCEIVNIYDGGLMFEPIHRAVFGVDPQRLYGALSSLKFGGAAESYTFVSGNAERRVSLPADAIRAVAVLTEFLDGYTKSEGGKVDYIHGGDELRAVCARPDAAGIALKAMSKDGLFPYIATAGALPKKTFSMGGAADKRYYLEARKIK
ncbi:MAG: DUF1015 domain-containing protein [Clostridiales bacterium]|jgi:hypothetical protein|nr:DUF1015 domain-containing protein [Clostridiales bacterium]